MSPLRSLPQEQNFLGLDSDHSDPAIAGVVVLQAPFEKTSSYGEGSCRGPAAILEASHEVELFDAALGFEPFTRCRGIATLEAISTEGLDGAAFNDRLAQEARHWIDQGRFVVTLGGEHTSIVGAVRAHCEAFEDVSVLQIDAHSDLRDEYQGDRWSHACAMARVLDFHENIAQVAIRSQAKEERQRAEALKLKVVHAHELHARRDDDWISEVIDSLRPRVYVTFDLDALDPSIMPATGTPEPGGLTWSQADRLCAALCRGREVIGFDVNELAPIEGLHHPQFIAAKLVHRFLGHRFSA